MPARTFDNSVRQETWAFRLLPHPAVRTANPQSVAVDGKGLDVSFVVALLAWQAGEQAVEAVLPPQAVAVAVRFEAFEAAAFVGGGP